MEVMSVAEIRRVDQIAIEQFSMASLVLMENAGRGAADRIAEIQLNRQVAERRVLILCGTGNNGGDGLVIARHLHARNIDVQVWVLGQTERMSPDAATNLKILDHTRIAVKFLNAALTQSHYDEEFALLQADTRPAGLIVDAMLGTGATGAPRAELARAIRAANSSEAVRIAIDIPTGLEADTAIISDPTFMAHHTLTMVALKPSFLVPSSKQFLGEIEVLSIGVPPEVLELARD